VIDETTSNRTPILPGASDNGAVQRRGPKPFDKLANTVHATLRAPGERGFAQLRAFKVLRRVRISPEPDHQARPLLTMKG
jgi:hypothetical protein